MKKTNALVIAVLCGGILSLWAGGAKETASAPERPDEIIFYMWEDPTYAGIVETFNRAQSKIVVRPQVVTSADYEIKLTTMLAGGVNMDAYMQKRQTDMFMQHANNYIQVLDDLIRKHRFDIGSVAPYLSAIRVDGKVLALPFRGGTYYTYFNKKMFDQAGLPYPSTFVRRGEWTWSKFAEIAERLSSGDGRRYGAVLHTWGLQQVIPAIQNGVDFITAKGEVSLDDSVLQSFRLRKGLERKRSIIPLVEQRASRLHYSQAFFNGNVGMLLMGEWFPGMMLNARDKGLLKDFTWNDWGVTRLPSDLSKYRSIGAPTFNHIHVDSKNKDSAFAFLAWMSGPEGAETVAKAGFLPAAITPQVKTALRQVMPDEDSFNYFTEGPEVYPIFYTKYGTAVEQVINQSMERYLLDGIKDEDLIKTLQAEFDKVVKAAN